MRFESNIDEQKLDNMRKKPCLERATIIVQWTG